MVEVARARVYVCVCVRVLFVLRVLRLYVNIVPHGATFPSNSVEFSVCSSLLGAFWEAATKRRIAKDNLEASGQTFPGNTNPWFCQKMYNNSYVGANDPKVRNVEVNK